ncbi:hypothetical protein CC86DRAFT_206865 [Ophiobolus disseminans]|uniref:Uncharacterized protein n=1 Tax=Ophiobolus disseminans TaxID=1469910 RepID=A0A6A7A5U9_9PLEO|nr:hypothetical protein CC86DRAFT_206865 [Ophiobolus disseminans]
MTTLGDLQMQLTQLFSVVNSQGYKLEDVLPMEMPDHFHDMTALKEAQAYINEFEIREKQIGADKANLASSLEAKQAEIDDQPEAFKALQVDLQQAQRSIEYYKELADNANERAARYQRKLEEASKAETVAIEESRKIQRMESDLVDREAAVYKLLDENRTMANFHETQHNRDLELIDEKENRIIALINRANQLDAERMQAVENAESASEIYDSLVKALEEESTDTAEQINRHMQRVRLSEQLYAVISTELAPINSFYSNAFDILSVYQSIFEKLSDPNCRAVPTVPLDLEAMLDIACENLDIFQAVSAAISTEGLAQEKVRQQVDDMAKRAGRMYASLDSIKKDVTSLVNRLRDDPSAWLATRGQSGSNHKLVSPASSIASFASIRNRLWS